MNSTAVNICVQVFVWIYALFFFGLYLGVELLGHMVALFNLVGNCQAVLQSGHTVLHSNQQHLRAPVSPHSWRHLLSSVLLILVILLGMKWYLIIVLSFIFLMTNVLIGYLCVIFGEVSA